MRTFASLLLGSSATLAACASGPGLPSEPPILLVTSPARSLVQGAAGTITVAGTVTPNSYGTAIKSVAVNGAEAAVGADGAFSISVAVGEGATLLHTVALDTDGDEADDTRSVEAGALTGPGAMVPGAVTAALSAGAFAKVASAAGPIIAGLDMAALLAPYQPMVHSGDEDGPDCLYGQLYVDNLTMSNTVITLVPASGGLTFSAELDNLDVPGHMSYAVACLGGTDSTDIKATKVVIGGTLDVAPNGNGGFTTSVANPTVDITGLDISSGGVPGAILDIVPLDSVIEDIAPDVAGVVMTPVVNQALGALGGPKQLTLLGKTLTVNVSPSAIDFTTAQGLVTLDMSVAIGGADGSHYTSITTGTPAMNAGTGLQLGLADNLANDLMAQGVALGLFDLSMPSPGGSFDTTAMAMTSPPMLMGTPDGKLQLVVPDMTATFQYQGTAVAQAAINAQIDVDVVPTTTGNGVQIQLGTPDVSVDVLTTIPNATHYTAQDLSEAVEITLAAQITSMSLLLGDIPLPQIAGIQPANLSIGETDGYAMITGNLQ